MKYAQKTSQARDLLNYFLKINWTTNKNKKKGEKLFVLITAMLVQSTCLLRINTA